MATLDFENDASLQLLSDALRAGPGSPQWREAVDRFGPGGPLGGDERALLYKVREDLASGKNYREVRAGPGFTRKVLAAIDEEREGRAKGVPTANVIAILSALVIVVLLGTVGYMLSRSGADSPVRPPQDLTQLNFLDTVMSATFDTRPGIDWKITGRLPLTFARGVRPGAPPQADAYSGGALMWDTPIAPELPVAIHVTLRDPAGGGAGGGDVIPQVFVTDTPTFSDDRATTPHELVFLVRTGEASVVLPSGRVPGETLAVKPNAPRLDVQITLARTTASVEAGGKKLWTGEHGLSESQPRYVGVRFLARGAEVKDPPTFQSIRVQKAKP